MTGLKARIIRGDYLGGHPQRVRKRSGVTLRLLEQGIEVNGVIRNLIEIPADEIVDVQVEADVGSARRPTGSVVALGVFALGVRKRIRASYIVINAADGDVILHVRKPPMSLQAIIAPFAALYSDLGRGDATRDMTPAGAAGADIPDQIAKLAALHDKGMITDDEFIAKKTDLLGRL